MKTVTERPKLDDFDYKVTKEYRTYCTIYDQFCEIEQELKKTELGSEKYDKQLRNAWKTYIGLMQWYHFMVANASISVADVRNRLTALGVKDLEGIWRRDVETAEEVPSETEKEPDEANPYECPYDPRVTCSAAVYACDVSDPERAKEVCAKCDHRKKAEGEA